MPDQPDRKARVDNERLRASYEAFREKLSGGEDSRAIVRVVAEIDEDFHLVGRAGRFAVEADEPAMRGGTDRAASPLQYLMLGLGF
jgi:hypothetical protein